LSKYPSITYLFESFVERGGSEDGEDFDEKEECEGLSIVNEGRVIASEGGRAYEQLRLWCISECRG